MSEKNKKRQTAKITVFITGIFVIFMSITYTFITQTLTGTKEVVVSVGVLDLVLEEENVIIISDVKYYLTKDGVGVSKLLSTLASDGTVDSGTIYFDDDDAPYVRFGGMGFGNEYETYVDPLGGEYEELIFVQLSDVIDENEIYVIEAGG